MRRRSGERAGLASRPSRRRRQPTATVLLDVTDHAGLHNASAWHGVWSGAARNRGGADRRPRNSPGRGGAAPRRRRRRPNPTSAESTLLLGRQACVRRQHRCPRRSMRVHHCETTAARCAPWRRRCSLGIAVAGGTRGVDGRATRGGNSCQDACPNALGMGREALPAAERRPAGSRLRALRAAVLQQRPQRGPLAGRAARGGAC
mmetsp:Transcript_83899/g.242590  ORF Transcript_83899/g.242590 Transcript_83899/m.242590 type:complete len:204 (+) Transcript_83899:470-1081(+)